MISDYYNRQYSLQRMNTKSIKLKSNQVPIQPFVIPVSHFHPNKKVYQELKYKCQKIKTQFSFITNEIQRELKQKKEKQEESQKFSKALFQKENRQHIQKQMTLTCKKLLKLHQFRKSNFQALKPKRLLTDKPNTLSQVIGHPVTYSPKKVSDKSQTKNFISQSKSRFRHSMGDE